MDNLLGSSNAAAPGAALQAAAGGGLFSSGFLSSVFSMAGDAMLDMLVSELSYNALDGFLGNLVDKPDLLREVQVTLPAAHTVATPDMKQQLVNMAAFLVAIKASGKVMDASTQDFDVARDSYQKLLDTRNQAVQLLSEDFYARSGPFAEQQAGKRGHLNGEQLAYLETLRDVAPEDFVRNFDAQNIALAYMSKAQPKDYADYRLNVDEFKGSYGSYAKTAMGASSMLGFSSMFLKRAKNMLEKNGLNAAPALMPLVTDGLGEVVSLAPRVQKTVAMSPELQDGSFAIRFANGEVKRDLSASKVFSSLSADSRASFQAGLFSNDQTGAAAFARLGEKYPLIAGRIMDGLLEKDTRQLFIKDYLQQEEMPDFSFQNVLSTNDRSAQNLKTALFRSAPTLQSQNPPDRAIAAVQNDVRSKLDKWDNSALRELIFANREAKKPDLQMSLADAEIFIDVPGMKGMLEFEEMASWSGSKNTARKAPGKTARR